MQTKIRDILAALANGRNLEQEECAFFMQSLLEDHVEPAQTGAFLMGLSQKGITAGEITGAVRIIRQYGTKIKAPEKTVDCCGTGGDGLKTLNISTAVAIVSAACGIPIAKHGNRAASSQSGAADVLEQLGVKLTDDTALLENALSNLNFAFLMAPNHYKNFASIAPVRKALGIKTIFNILGPLLNPAGAKIQLIGVFSKSLLEPVAHSLKSLGSERAWLVHASNGMDEISLAGDTFVTSLENHQIESFTISAVDFGLPSYSPEEIRGGSATENAKALKDLLNGMPGAYRDTVLANTAAVLHIAGKAETLKQGVEIAKDVIDSGASLSLLENYIAMLK